MPRLPATAVLEPEQLPSDATFLKEFHWNKTGDPCCPYFSPREVEGPAAAGPFFIGRSTSAVRKWVSPLHRNLLSP